MAFARVALKFATLPDAQLEAFAGTVIAGMTANSTLYPTPPVSMLILTGQKNDFSTKLAAAPMGGPADTAAKNASRQVLLGSLRQLAAYVEMVANGDEAKLLKSGFEARSTERSSAPLTKPEGLTVTNAGDGKLNAEVEPVKNCSMYEGRIKPDGGDWMPYIHSGDSRHILFMGLTPGVLYTIQVRALGGSEGESDWSDPVQHRSL